MTLRSDTIYRVCCDKRPRRSNNSGALGIVACLYAYSNLSFDDGTGAGEFAEVCAEHYHWLRDYAMDHAEVRSILRAID